MKIRTIMVLLVFLAMLSSIALATKTSTWHDYNLFVAGGNLSAVNIIGNISASYITSGTIDNARISLVEAEIPSLTGSWAGYLNATRIADITTCVGTNVSKYDGNKFTCMVPSSASVGNTTEEIQDAAWSVLTGTQSGISVTYNDAGNAVDFLITSFNYHNISGLPTCTSTQRLSYDGTNVNCVENPAAGANFWLDSGSYITPNETYAAKINASELQAPNIVLRYNNTIQSNVTVDSSGNIDWW